MYSLVIFSTIVFLIAALSIHYWFPLHSVPRLKAKLHNDEQVMLTWETATDGYPNSLNWSYQKKGETSEYGDWMNISAEVDENGVFSYIVGELRRGFTYTFRVKSITDNNESIAISDEVTITLPQWSDDAMQSVESIGTVLEQLQSPDLVSDLDVIVERFNTIAAQLTQVSDDPPTFCVREELGELYFDHDSYALEHTDNSCDCGKGQSNQDVLNTIHDRLDQQQGLVLVEGFASYPGANTYNLQLSERRVDAVVSHLLQRRQNWCGQFRAIGKGETYRYGYNCHNVCSRRVRVSLCTNQSLIPPNLRVCGESDL